MNENRLFLLDAYALIFRAYYALIKMPRVTRDGFNTSAIFGFVNTLEEVIRKEKPTHLAVCFDPQGPTFRSEADPTYKAQRDSTPEDIKLSIPIIKEIIRAYNIPILEVPGFEADDVIGTMSRRAAGEGMTTYMMSPDKDFGQLVGPNVLQYKPSYRGQDFELRGEKEVCARYGLENTHQVIDYLALTGDSSDNIPGCPGIGEKTATKLLKEFGSVENLLANTDKIKGANRTKLETYADQIRHSYFMATIRTDVPVPETIDDLKRRPADTSKLFAIFRSLEFRTLSERVERRMAADGEIDAAPAPKAAFPTSLFDDAETEPTRDSGERPRQEKVTCQWLKGAEGADVLERALNGKDRCGICWVADGENDMDCLIKGVALAVDPATAYWCPATETEVVAVVLDTMARADIRKVSTQAKRDYVLAHRMRSDSVTPLVNYADVTLGHYLLEPDMRHGLDGLAAQYLDYTTLPEILFKPRRSPKRAASTPEEIAAWATEQACLCLSLEPLIMADVRRDGLDKLLDDVELPLSTVLAEMEITGVRIDTAALDEAAASLEDRLRAIEQEVFALAGEEFNIGSPAKVGEILFDKLKLDDKVKKTNRGQYSTAEAVLESVAHKNPIVNKILEYRQLKKLLTTYLLALPAAINPATGKIHTVYNQAVTATGRISSSAPNLQNIPVREDEGREIRRAFIADEGDLFLSADYSQIELRLVADFSGDETMLDAFRHDRDIHAATAAKIYHKDPDEVTADERRHAKTANFGILYGISAFGLSQRLGIPRAEAQELIDNYFKTFPTIFKYMSDSVEGARENGYVSTSMGRRRKLPDINSKNPVVRGYAERNAVNAPIQGAAADIIKVAMVDIFRRMREAGMKSRMIMQVHDELNFNVVPDELPALQQIVTECMEGAYGGRVRLTAQSGVAGNWLDAH